MEKFCEVGKLEKKSVDGVSIYDVCRGKKQRGELRYDLTRIYPQRFGRELPRTFGHYHAKGQTELFEVISGRALFFIQRHEKKPEIIKEAYLVEAVEKDKVIIPPDFSVTSINHERKKELLISNWVNANVKNEYEHFKNLEGNCYRVLEDKNGEIVIEKNKNYASVPELIKLKSKKLLKELENLEFLNNPKKFKKLLTIQNCYKISK